MNEEKYNFNLEYCSPENREAVMRFLNDFTADGRPPKSLALGKCFDFHCDREIGGEKHRELIYAVYEQYGTVLVMLGARFAVMHVTDFDKCFAALSKRQSALTPEEKALREKIAKEGLLS